jgi:hypothetical protein
MKFTIKKVSSLFARNNFLWSVLNATLIPMVRHIEWERSVREISSDLSVRHGVFKGMKYPLAAAVGSALIPKLIGSYESEIHGVIEEICSVGYTEIVDIGCAEGYYAVGLAMRISGAMVYAYDTDQTAIRLCKIMARLNGVGGRLLTGSYCDATTLKSIPSSGRGLVVCDCEGCEKELFTPDTVRFLESWDLLIEIHDFIDAGISSQLRKQFESTHDLRVFASVDDAWKAGQCDYEEIQRYDLDKRTRLLAEGRPTAMEWFFLTRKQKSNFERTRH